MVSVDPLEAFTVCNEQSLKTLMRAVVLAKGQFSLVLVRCNYASLQTRMMEQLQMQLQAEIRSLVLSPSVTNLQGTIDRALAERQPETLAILGLGRVVAIDELLVAANQMRDELRKSCPFPVLLWVNDAVLLKLIRFAPDLKSWAVTSIKFAIAPDRLLSFLTHQAETIFERGLQSGNYPYSHFGVADALPARGGFAFLECRRLYAGSAKIMELEFARWDLDSQGIEIQPVVAAGLELILGQYDYVRDQLDSALKRLHQSLYFLEQAAQQNSSENLGSEDLGSEDLAALPDSDTVFSAKIAPTTDRQAPRQPLMGQHTADQHLDLQHQTNQQLDRPHSNLPCSPALLEKQGLVFLQIGICHCRYAELHPGQNRDRWQAARHFLQAGIAIFERLTRQRFVVAWMLQLGEVLQSLKDWDALQALAERVLQLHPMVETPAQLARAYSFLAEVALERRQWHRANQLARQALATLSHVPPPQTQKRDLNPDQLRTWRFAARENSTFQNGRVLLLLLLAQSQRHLGQREAAITNLEQARQESNPDYHPQRSLRILEALRSLYFENKRYRNAFHVKQEQRSLAQQYGFRAFVGAVPLQPKRQAIHPALNRQRRRNSNDSHPLPVAVAPEIVAAGQLQAVHQLLERISRNDCKLTVIHGDSGVGKSSILKAGLLPALQQKNIGDRYAVPVILRVYTDWEGALGRQLAKGLAQWWGEPERSILLANPPSSTQAILERLRTAVEGNLLIAIVFDQLEEFFFACTDCTERQRFYQFLSDCLNLPFVKAILSLREDYLHYLLECERSIDLGAANNNILDKDIRYYLGNLTPANARSAIQCLTEQTEFSLEAGLVEQLVRDLADQGGRISPIELQVVGAQLQESQIATLYQYQQLGSDPKTRLVQHSLEHAIQDCGRENEAVAWCVLGTLTDEKGTRPLKTKSELVAALKLQADRLDLVLEILVGTGLIALLREDPEDRYQLVHDYLVDPIRSKHASGMQLLLSRAEAAKKLSQAKLDRTQKWGLRVAVGLSAIALALATVAESQRRQVAISEAIAQNNALTASSEALFASHKEFDALIEGLRAWEQLKQMDRAITTSHIRVVTTLHQAIYGIRERNRLEGHRDVVWGLSFSPDGQLLASASNDRTVKLWRPNGQLAATLNGHENRLTSVHFSPDGESLVSSSSDGTARLWSRTGKVLATLVGHQQGVQSASFSPDGQQMVTASLDGTARLWDRQGNVQAILSGHRGSVNWAVFAPDAQLVATGGEDQTVRLWSLNGKLLKTLRADQGEIFAIAFSPNGEQLATAGDDGSIKLWNRNGQIGLVMQGHKETIWNLAFSADGKTLASASADKTVKLWNQAGQLLETFRGHGDWVTSVSFSPNQPILASASFDKTIKFWSLEAPSPIRLQGHRDRVTAISFSPDSQRLASASRDNTIKLWRRNGTLIRTLKGHRDRVTSVHFSPNGQHLASASGDHTIKLWDKNGKPLTTLQGHRDDITSIHFSPDSQILASASKDTTIKLWQKNGTLLKTLPGHQDRINSIHFSPDGTTLASASDDRTVKLWSRNGTLLKTLRGHDNWVLGVSFSPDSQTLASASWDNTVKLWSRNGTLLKTLLKGYGDSVTSVSFSPPTLFLGSTKPQLQNRQTLILAAASWDGNVKLWSQDGTLLKILSDHQSGVLSVSFSPDGQLLASAGADNTTVLWNLNLDDLVKRSCHWLKDYFQTNPNAQEDRRLCNNIVNFEF